MYSKELARSGHALFIIRGAYIYIVIGIGVLIAWCSGRLGPFATAEANCAWFWVSFAVATGAAILRIIVGGYAALGTSGNAKKAAEASELNTTGPYSLVRNPLYVFTIIGVAGVGAQTGSLTMAVGLALLVAIVFYAVALQEQAFLADAFGDEYRAYAERVPLFLPRFSTWQEADQLTIVPMLVRRTFMDASLFLLAIPLDDVIRWLQDNNWVHVLAHLP